MPEISAELLARLPDAVRLSIFEKLKRYGGIRTIPYDVMKKINKIAVNLSLGEISREDAIAELYNIFVQDLPPLKAPAAELAERIIDETMNELGLKELHAVPATSEFEEWLEEKILKILKKHGVIK